MRKNQNPPPKKGANIKPLRKPENLIPKNEPPIGHEVSRPLDHMLGKLFPKTFNHTGIYCGKGQVISKYIDFVASDSSIVGKGKIVLEYLVDWKDWKLERKGDRESAAKALSFFHDFQKNPFAEVYHIETSNCKHFTTKCLAPGIASEWK